MKTNHCFVVGNLGSDPVERARTEKTGPIVGFTVAENVQAFDPESRTYKTTHTNWFQITAFGSLADRARLHLKKGDRVAIQGRMKVSKFTDRNGAERPFFEIIADDIALWQVLPGANASEREDEPQVPRPHAASGPRPDAHGKGRKGIAPQGRRDAAAQNHSIDSDESLPF